MANSDMSGQVQTVLGPVSPENLGPTTTHEHLLIDFTCMFDPPKEASERFKAFAPVTLENLGWIRYNPFRNKDNLEVLDQDLAIHEILQFKAQGGGTVVDATTFGIGRDPKALTRISRLTGVNVVMGAGFYVDAVHPDDMDHMTDTELGDEIITQLSTGVDNTDIKAGIIGELGCSWPLTENERKVLAGGARAQVSTGAAILIHPGRNIQAPFEIIDVLAESGADPEKIIMGHIDRTVLEEDVLLKLAERGTYLEYDLFGMETSYYALSDIDLPSDAQRIGFIKLLIEAGFADRIVLAHDVFAKSRLTKYGGPGIGHILENIVPRMLEAGISENDINKMTVQNPARILPFS